MQFNKYTHTYTHARAHIYKILYKSLYKRVARVRVRVMVKSSHSNADVVRSPLSIVGAQLQIQPERGE